MQNQQRLIEIFKEPPIISYRKGHALRTYSVRAKLWRSDFDQVHESCVARRLFLNQETWDVSSLIPCFLG